MSRKGREGEGTAPSFRDATLDDLPALVAMLADDPLGSRREQVVDPLPAPYLEAFRAIDGDANQRLVVATLEGSPAGMMQVTFIPSLTYKGRWRAQLEGVRVRSDLRRGGLGRAMVEEAVALARSRGCHVLQLTTDKQRPRAIAFYERLGFKASHEGMKRPLG